MLPTPKKTTRNKIFHFSVKCFDVDIIGSVEETGRSISFSETFYVLTKYNVSCLFSSLFLIARGHAGGMHLNRECGVIQNEYSYVQGGSESYDKCIYTFVLFLFLFWQHRSVISNEKPSNFNENFD